MTLLLYFFALPLFSITAWLVLLVARPAVLDKKWPYLATIGVALACALVAGILYYSPHSLLAYEGDEADPRGVNILILACNALFGSAVTAVLWLIAYLVGVLRRGARVFPRPMGPMRPKGEERDDASA